MAKASCGKFFPPFALPEVNSHPNQAGFAKLSVPGDV